MKIAIGNDHAGTQHKEAIIAFLESKNYEVINFGTNTTDSVDYPDYGHSVADAVENQKADLGIIICGSGNGIAITANKHQKVRCALCWNAEIAELAKQHNNANVISLPARYISIDEAIEIIDAFLKTEFEGGRHEKRVQKIPCN